MMLDFSPWVALVLGILIGWLLGWSMDLWFDRRRHAEDKARDELRRAELEELRRLRTLELVDVPPLALRSDMSFAAAVEEEPLPPLQGEHLADDLSTPAVEVEVVDVDEDAPAESDAAAR